MKSPGDTYIFFFRDIKDYVSQKNLSQFTMHTPVTHFCVIKFVDRPNSKRRSFCKKPTLKCVLSFLYEPLPVSSF